MTTATVTGALPVVIDSPGVYSITPESYHADPVPGGSLSSTGVRKLLTPSCPALFKQWLTDGDTPKQEWDIGHGAHKLVLDAGVELVRIDAEEWRTKVVKAQVAETRERGAVPLRPSDYDTVHAMAHALRQHPVASRLFAPDTGLPEQTLIWRDDHTGMWCRALVDFLRYPAAGHRLLLPDYKSGRTAAPEKLGRTMADFGYHVQLAWYLMGAQALGIAGDDAQALLVVQETRPPYLVTVAQPDPTAMRMGAIRARQALEIYAECRRTDTWPGYSDEVVLAELPPWETRELDGEVW